MSYASSNVCDTHPLMAVLCIVVQTYQVTVSQGQIYNIPTPLLDNLVTWETSTDFTVLSYTSHHTVIGWATYIYSTISLTSHKIALHKEYMFLKSIWTNWNKLTWGLSVFDITVTLTLPQECLPPFILPASWYWASGLGDLADRAENRPPRPHWPASSATHQVGYNTGHYRETHRPYRLGRVRPLMDN